MCLYKSIVHTRIILSQISVIYHAHFSGGNVENIPHTNFTFVAINEYISVHCVVELHICV